MINTIIRADAPSPLSVSDYFESKAPFWRDIYQNDDVFAVIHQERRAIVLSLVESMSLPASSTILEIGCGAGTTSVALAHRGYSVEATDVVPSMLDLTKELVTQTGVEHLVHTRQCDTHELPYETSSFPLALAIGVLPWLESIDAPMREMARVIKPGGHLIVTVDNRIRLNHLLHPFACARATGFGIPDRLAFWRRHRNGPSAKMYSPSEFESRLSGYGLKKVSSRTLGFGPFWGIARLFSRGFEVRLHHILQSWADRGLPLLRSTGSQYIAVLEKVERLSQPV